MPVALRTRDVKANPEALWRVVERLDRYHEWESGYVSSSFLSEQTAGVGTRRRVELKSPMGVRYAIHEVTKWEPPSLIAWRAVESNFPMLKTAEQTLTIRSSNTGASVENRVEYELGMGALGGLLDAAMFRRLVIGANEGFLDSLEAAVSSSM